VVRTRQQRRQSTISEDLSDYAASSSETCPHVDKVVYDNAEDPPYAPHRCDTCGMHTSEYLAFSVQCGNPWVNRTHRVCSLCLDRCNLSHDDMTALKITLVGAAGVETFTLNDLYSRHDKPFQRCRTPLESAIRLFRQAGEDGKLDAVVADEIATVFRENDVEIPVEVEPTGGSARSILRSYLGRDGYAQFLFDTIRDAAVATNVECETARHIGTIFMKKAFGVEMDGLKVRTNTVDAGDDNTPKSS